MSEHYPFQKINLPYHYAGLAPTISPNTLYVHDAALLAGYVDTLNFLVAQYPQYHDWSLERLITGKLLMPETDRLRIQNYAGAVFNHRLFFDRACPKGSSKPGPHLSTAIANRYGSMAQFQQLFQQAAHSILGSGWVWLNTDSDGNLHIAITSDNAAPALHAFTPILVLDVWEHAYFLQFPAQLDRYIQTWFSLINWDKAEEAFLQATSGRQR